MYVKDVMGKTIGIIPYVLLKYLVELYQKYRPKSEVHLVDKANPKRDTTHLENMLTIYC